MAFRIPHSESLVWNIPDSGPSFKTSTFVLFRNPHSKGAREGVFFGRDHGMARDKNYPTSSTRADYRFVVRVRELLFGTNPAMSGSEILDKPAPQLRAQFGRELPLSTGIPPAVQAADGDQAAGNGAARLPETSIESATKGRGVRHCFPLFLAQGLQNRGGRRRAMAAVHEIFGRPGGRRLDLILRRGPFAPRPSGAAALHW